MDGEMVEFAQRIAEAPRMTWLMMVVFDRTVTSVKTQGIRLVRSDRELF